MARYIHSDVESDEFVNVGYRSLPPRKRDFWRVLLGRWEPEVVRESRFTVKGLDRCLRQTWTSEKVQAAWLEPSPLEGLLVKRESHDDA